MLLQCGLRYAQLQGSLVLRLAFEVAEHERRPITLRESAQLRVQHLLHVAPAEVRARLRGWGWFVGLVLLPFGELRPSLERGAIGDRIQPAPDRRLLADRAGLLGQEKESDL